MLGGESSPEQAQKMNNDQKVGPENHDKAATWPPTEADA